VAVQEPETHRGQELRRLAWQVDGAPLAHPAFDHHEQVATWRQHRPAATCRNSHTTCSLGRQGAAQGAASYEPLLAREPLAGWDIKVIGLRTQPGIESFGGVYQTIEIAASFTMGGHTHPP